MAVLVVNQTDFLLFTFFYYYSYQANEYVLFVWSSETMRHIFGFFRSLAEIDRELVIVHNKCHIAKMNAECMYGVPVCADKRWRYSKIKNKNQKSKIGFLKASAKQRTRHSGGLSGFIWVFYWSIVCFVFSSNLFQMHMQRKQCEQFLQLCARQGISLDVAMPKYSPHFALFFLFLSTQNSKNQYLECKFFASTRERN